MPAQAQKVRLYDGGNNSTGRPTIQTGVRIWKEQKNFLLLNYPGNSSLLIRYLLEKFITSPAAQQEFDQFVSKLNLAAVK